MTTTGTSTDSLSDEKASNFVQIGVSALDKRYRNAMERLEQLVTVTKQRGKPAVMVSWMKQLLDDPTHDTGLVVKSETPDSVTHPNDNQSSHQRSTFEITDWSSRVVGCPQCQEWFLRSHVRRHLMHNLRHGRRIPARHQCTTCDYSDDDLLVVLNHRARAPHSVTNDTERQPMCYICAESFAGIDALIRHLMHHDQMPVGQFRCPVDAKCGYTTDDSKDIDAHVKRHRQRQSHLLSLGVNALTDTKITSIASFESKIPADSEKSTAEPAQFSEAEHLIDADIHDAEQNSNVNNSTESIEITYRSNYGSSWSSNNHVSHHHNKSSIGKKSRLMRERSHSSSKRFRTCADEHLRRSSRKRSSTAVESNRCRRQSAVKSLELSRSMLYHDEFDSDWDELSENEDVESFNSDTDTDDKSIQF